MGTLR